MASFAEFVARTWPNNRLRDVSTTAGSCQFESISHQLYNTTLRHPEVRRTAVQYIATHQHRYDGLMLPTPAEYIACMTEETTWGDHLTLDAVANAYAVNIEVAAAFKTPVIISVVPQKQHAGAKTLKIGIKPENHYMSTVPVVQ